VSSWCLTPSKKTCLVHRCRLNSRYHCHTKREPDAEEEGHEVLSVSLTKEQDDASVAIINTLAPAECKAPKEAAVEFMDRFAGTLPWLSQKSACREI
jgi:hypothetical protein